MIPLEEALETVMNSVFKTGTETIPCLLALDRILAENVSTDIDMPPFNRASVDVLPAGNSELDHDLEIIETILQERSRRKLSVRIMLKNYDRSCCSAGADCV